MTASCAMDDRDACPWMRLICSRRMMFRKKGRKARKFGRVAEEVRTGRGRW